MERDVGILANCLLCDSYFMYTVTRIVLAEYRGKAKRYLELTYQRLQQKYKDSFIYLRCPLCIEIVTGMKYLEWLNSTLDAVLTICHIPSFGDDPLPPIYLDIGEHKPKWELVKGTGPSIDLDGSKSGKIWKSSLKQWGVKTSSQYVEPLDSLIRYTPPENKSAQDHEYIINIVHKAIQKSEDQRGLLNNLLKHKPLFVNWDLIAADIETLALSMDDVKLT